MIRVAVIGVGAMGRNHARVYREMPNAELVGIADEDVATAQHVARLNNTTAYASAQHLFEEARPDAVTVAVPTGLHFQIVQMALQAGSHVLVEKPIASTLEEGDALVALARDCQRVLMVGHVERYNPAVIELKRRLEAGALGRLFQIHTRRLGPFPARVRDVGVVIDLATHDLDIMRYLAGSEATRVYAETRRQIHTSNEDLLGGLVHFAQDILGILEINWLTPSKIRELYVTGERGMFVANYLTQDLYFYENAEIAGSNWETLRILRGVSEGSMTRFALQRKEPLYAEQEAFLTALNGDDRDIVRGQDGLEALRLALALIESGQTHDVIHLAAEPIC